VEYRRTAVIKLDTPESADAHLRETVEQFKYCANTASRWCWHGDDGYHVTSKSKAEQALYDQLREDTELTANLVQKGIRQAVEAVTSGVERLKNDQDTSRPTFTADTTVYDKRSATFHRDHVSLSTVNGRIECDYILPDDADTPPTKYVTDEDYEFRRATLHRRDGDWYLHASMLKEDDDTDTTTGHRTVLGVNQLAVASTGRFWSADEFDHWKQEYQKRRVRERQPHVLATTRYDQLLHPPVRPQLWGWFLSTLDLIVIDEQQQYRGVFGSHVGVVIRRLRRLAKTFDADPTIVACSATIDNPRQHTVQLTGVNPADVHVIDPDTSAGGSTHWLFWQPPRGQQGQARSTHRTTARLAAALVERGLQTIVFTRSRQAAEQCAQVAARRLQRDGSPGLADDVAAYQAALSDERREELEAGLHSGDIRAVWSANALKVGVNIGNLDAVLVDGYPGTRMELFQQAGRAGRGTDPSIVGLVGGGDPLDQYALDHSDNLLDGSVESVECNPRNPRVVTEHLPAAAAEAPLTTDDDTWFGDDLPKYVSALTDAGVLDRSLTSTDVTWTYVPDGGPPPSQHVSLRSINSRSLRITVTPDDQSPPGISASDDRDVLGELPLASGLREAHPGAIYFPGSAVPRHRCRSRPGSATGDSWLLLADRMG
jgi:ATP-dependent helicase YprA (DUF1998 family)